MSARGEVTEVTSASSVVQEEVVVLPIALVAVVVVWSFGAALALALCRTATLGDRAAEDRSTPPVARSGADRRTTRALAPASTPLAVRARPGV